MPELQTGTHGRSGQALLSMQRCRVLQCRVSEKPLEDAQTELQSTSSARRSAFITM